EGINWGKLPMLMGRAGCCGFLSSIPPAAPGAEPLDDAPASPSGNASPDGAYATVLETYRGSGGAKKSAGIEEKEALTQ
ncbi:hypothetical protein, partial [Salmonella enterica]